MEFKRMNFHSQDRWWQGLFSCQKYFCQFKTYIRNEQTFTILCNTICLKKLNILYFLQTNLKTSAGTHIWNVKLNVNNHSAGKYALNNLTWARNQIKYYRMTCNSHTNKKINVRHLLPVKITLCNILSAFVFWIGKYFSFSHELGP